MNRNMRRIEPHPERPCWHQCRDLSTYAGFMVHKPAQLRPPEMPDGTMDWQWWHEATARKKAVYAAGYCPDCHKRPLPINKAVCGDLCDRSEDFQDLYQRRCAYCGTHRNILGGSGSVFYAVWISYCEGCKDRKIPPADAFGQARLL